MNYTVFCEKPTFLQLEAPREFIWPVDLMFVNEETWGKMLAGARSISIGNARCKVPNLLHLIALKVHALQHGHAARFMKDFQDVEGLIKINGLDVASGEMKYSNVMELPSSTKKSRERAAEIESAIASFVPAEPALEFPIQPDFNPQPPHLDPVAMYWRCEELMRQGARPCRERLHGGIEAEFIL